jgi:hypothetical protein
MAQELRRDQAVRLPNPSAQPFVAALRTCRFYAVLFFWITMVCVVAYAAAFVATEWIGLYDVPRTEAARPVDGKPAAEPAAAPAAPAAPTAPVAPITSPAAPAGTSWLAIFENTASAATTSPARESAEVPSKTPTFFGIPATPTGAKDASRAVETPKKAAPDVTVKEAGDAAAAAAKEAETKGEAVARPETPAVPERPAMTPQQKAQHYYDITVNILKPLRVVGVLSSFLLGVTLFLYLQIALLGRLAGIKQLTAALFFLLLFFATVLPWENIFEGFRVNVFYDFTRLVATHVQRMAGETGDFWEQAKYFARFLGLPLVSIALLAWSGLQFASGYAESVVANE